MRWLIDGLLGLIALVTAPIWLVRMISTGKIRTDWPGRFGRTGPLAAASERPRVLIHAVSVGEVNAIRLLVNRLFEAGLDVVVAVTTDTGFARARSLFGGRHEVVRYPLDFSFAVDRFLHSVARTARGLRGTRGLAQFHGGIRAAWGADRGRQRAAVSPKLREIPPRAAVDSPELPPTDQGGGADQAYADRFVALGTPPGRILVTGTMKWDAIEVEVDAAAASRLAKEMGIDRDRPLVVAGSTAPGEHELLHDSVPDGADCFARHADRSGSTRRPAPYPDGATLARRSRQCQRPVPSGYDR